MFKWLAQAQEFSALANLSIFYFYTQHTQSSPPKDDNEDDDDDDELASRLALH